MLCPQSPDIVQGHGKTVLNSAYSILRAMVLMSLPCEAQAPRRRSEEMPRTRGFLTAMSSLSPTGPSSIPTTSAFNTSLPQTAKGYEEASHLSAHLEIEEATTKDRGGQETLLCASRD